MPPPLCETIIPKHVLHGKVTVEHVCKEPGTRYLASRTLATNIPIVLCWKHAIRARNEGFKLVEVRTSPDGLTKS